MSMALFQVAEKMTRSISKFRVILLVARPFLWYALCVDVCIFIEY